MDTILLKNIRPAIALTAGLIQQRKANPRTYLV